MKKLMILFAICTFAINGAFSQDDQYYTEDQATVTDKTQTPPPPLPDYVQPPCPYDGYLWSPGYWAWSGSGYYWVPGVWVRPPQAGFFWTPGYWGFYSGFYGWHPGYWGPHVGYYGGVNYGYGYFGSGFYGGRWEGGVFRYNTAVWHVNAGVIHNTYVSREGFNPHVANHASFNGPGGVRYRPTANEQQAMHETHARPTTEQLSHHQTFGNEKGQFHSPNARPAVHTMNAPNGQRFNERGRPAGGGAHAAPSRGGGGGHGGGGRR